MKFLLTALLVTLTANSFANQKPIAKYSCKINNEGRTIASVGDTKVFVEYELVKLEKSEDHPQALDGFLCRSKEQIASGEESPVCPQGFRLEDSLTKADTCWKKFTNNVQPQCPTPGAYIDHRDGLDKCVIPTFTYTTPLKKMPKFKEIVKKEVYYEEEE